MFYYSPSVKRNRRRDKNGKVRNEGYRATVYYKDPETKEVKQKTKMLPEATGKKEAQKMAEAWRDELNKVYKNSNPDAREKTIRELIESYEDNRLATLQIEKSTYKRDILVSKKYIYPYFGEYLLTSIDREDLSNWITELFKTLSPTTVRNAYGQLKKVYNYYTSIGQLEKNPFDGYKPPKGGAPKKTHLAREQTNKFKEAVFSQYQPYEPMYVGCLLAYYGGLRRGEICGLRWRNIDFERRTITIESAIGYADGGNYTKRPKTDSSERTFPILPQLYSALKTRYDYIKPKENWFVIGNKDTFMSLQAFTANFHKLAEEWDLKDFYGKRLTPHALRHNAASVGIRSGMDIASLTVMMGHASRAMTLDIYGDADPDALKMAVDKLGLQFDDDTDLDEDDETAEKLYEIEQKIKG